MKRWLRFTAAVLAAAFLFALTGCGSSTNSASFTWFVDSIPANLDPQVASGASDVIACENLYGTLVRKDPDGELVPGLCEKWTVSSDGLTYTFTLKDGLHYAAAKGAATEYDITAEDFVFAFRRIFRADTASPYAVEFSAIQNSAAVQAGLADESSLGVSANGALTLQVARSLKRIGLHWGSDIGLLGFDELEWAELAGVGITTLKQPTWQIGYAAVEQVVRRIEGTSDAVREQVFSGELIVRGSTAR